ncbi:hypothetical protein DFJ74DRAFT_648724 [Hyaloraphidium curvatum]|nr:hypothetical protein DFJ74DRAFT_648724 [Hyaloraphidium curvatum]
MSAAPLARALRRALRAPPAALLAAASGGAAPACRPSPAAPRAMSTALGAAGAGTSLRKATRAAAGPGAAVLQARTMFVQVEETPNNNALKFKPGVAVMGTEFPVTEYTSGREATASPLARRLFKIDGVKTLMLGPDFITITKDEDDPWQLMKPDIFAAIMDHYASGQPVYDPALASNAADTAPSDEDDEVVAMIKELLDTRIRPAIQEDGGDVEFRGFERGTVKLKLKGSCRSCSSSTVTLKNGIEQMLMHYLPEVEAVEQVLDEYEQIADDAFKKLESKLEAA